MNVAMLLVGVIVCHHAALRDRADVRGLLQDPKPRHWLDHRDRLTTGSDPGGLCSHAPALAITFGVVLSLLLTYRQSLHRFVRTQLSEHEIRDGLILAIAALVIMPLVIMPLVPDRFIGPFAAINLHTVLIMMVGTAGDVAMRLVGTRYGTCHYRHRFWLRIQRWDRCVRKNPRSCCRPVPR